MSHGILVIRFQLAHGSSFTSVPAIPNFMFPRRLHPAEPFAQVYVQSSTVRISQVSDDIHELTVYRFDGLSTYQLNVLTI